jgi:hypothetical protein
MRGKGWRSAVISGIALLCVSSGYAHAELSATEIVTKSDAELTALTARWGELSPTERRVVLHEVRSRMHASKVAATNSDTQRVGSLRRQATGTVVQRRYGRKSDGSVVVQTRVIKKRIPKGARVTFGFGFERRANGRIAPKEQQESGNAETQVVKQPLKARASTP